MDDLSMDLSIDLSSRAGRAMNRCAPIVINLPPPPPNNDEPPTVGDDPTWDPNGGAIGGGASDIIDYAKKAGAAVVATAVHVSIKIKEKTKGIFLKFSAYFMRIFLKIKKIIKNL